MKRLTPPFFGKENIGREKDHFYQIALVETFNFQVLCLARENSVGFDNTDLRPDILNGHPRTKFFIQ